jgi:peptidoglycan-associated lipoprotein
MKRVFATAGLIAFLGLLSACGSSVKLDDEKGGAPVENRDASANGANSSGLSERAVAQVNAPDPLNDPNSPLAKRSIYFEYDSFVIKDEFRPTVEAHAKYLLANKGKKVIIQGNTDERGSREYNLALGQKRAEAVRRALVSLGVSDAQLEAVSFGKEKPRATGSDEAAYAENRRADLAYQ